MGTVNLLAQKASKTHLVKISGFKFEPENLTVKLGDKITWKNVDIVPHTATGSNFDSKEIAHGKAWSFKPKTKGTYKYICSYHPGMMATFTVD